ncbi:MAG: phosphatidylglycerophosphatase A, partial [Thiopseudomonas sp.]|nr:phosphatidylglycerophosphatase A [Thiopseudomonas sp.]
FVPLLHMLPLWLALLLIAAASVFGVWLCGRVATDLGVHDHGGIVWDEFVGIWITLIFLPNTWLWLLLGFVVFRLLDIAKPWPISVLDRKVGGGFGIMIDDILAGVIAAGVLYAAWFFTL